MKIISYCLYGEDYCYKAGLKENLRLLKKWYPDYVIYVYCPLDYTWRLEDSRIKWQPVEHKNLMLARALAANDGDASFRDLDSRLSEQDYRNIEAWLKTEHRGMYYGKTLRGGAWGLKQNVITVSTEVEPKFGVDEDIFASLTNDWLRVPAIASIFEKPGYDADIAIIPDPLAYVGQEIVGTKIAETKMYPLKWDIIVWGSYKYSVGPGYNRVRGSVDRVDDYIATPQGLKLLRKYGWSNVYRRAAIFAPQTTKEIQVPPRSEESVMAKARKIFSFTQAVFTGEYVDKETQDKRIELCSKCDQRDGDVCGVCGCSVVKSDFTKLVELTAYKENLPKWGCKHPQRKEGKGWPT